MVKLLIVLLVASPAVLAACQDETVVVTGVLRQVGVEGGAWALDVEGCTYDLHGDVTGFKAGDRVKVTGVARPDKACIHMIGVVLEVRKIGKG